MITRTRFGQEVKDANLELDRCEKALYLVAKEYNRQPGLVDYWSIQVEYANLREHKRKEYLKWICSEQIKWQLGIRR
jgi:hypothetical protein